MQRGIVVCPSYTLDGHTVRLTCDVPPQDLRRYLLYWDRLAYAYPNGFGAPNLDALHDLRFLKDEGLLTLRDVRVTAADIELPSPVAIPNLAGHPGPLFETAIPTADNPSGVRALGIPIEVWRDLNYWAPIRAAVDLQASEGTVWSVGQSGTRFVLPQRRGPMVGLLEASICAALPVPDETTSLEDILEFRTKRTPELLRLRRALDTLRDSALQADDLQRGIARSRDEISLALSDIHRALNESGLGTFFSTLRLYLDLSDNKVMTTILGMLGAQGIGLPLEIGAAAALGLNTVLTFAARTASPPPPLAQHLSDYRYLYEVAKHWPSIIKRARLELF
ncbi:MAG: hypothetical protein KF778_18820 [Rhodocyclaceae bacterium]|nr:hypothetical protein [Rhodocyclaceae bacterium]